MTVPSHDQPKFDAVAKVKKVSASRNRRDAQQPRKSAEGHEVEEVEDPLFSCPCTVTLVTLRDNPGGHIADT